MPPVNSSVSNLLEFFNVSVGRISIAIPEPSGYAYVRGAIDAADRGDNEQAGLK